MSSTCSKWYLTCWRPAKSVTETPEKLEIKRALLHIAHWEAWKHVKNMQLVCPRTRITRTDSLQRKSDIECTPRGMYTRLLRSRLWLLRIETERELMSLPYLNTTLRLAGCCSSTAALALELTMHDLTGHVPPHHRISHFSSITYLTVSMTAVSQHGSSRRRTGPQSDSSTDHVLDRGQAEFTWKKRVSYLRIHLEHDTAKWMKLTMRESRIFWR